MFAHPDIVSVVENHFIAAAFNTWDRDDKSLNEAHKKWGAGLAKS